MQGSTANDFVLELQQRIEKHRPRTKGIPREAFRSLARALLKRADQGYLLEGAAQRWLAHAEALTAFVLERKEGDILVRVSEPQEGVGGQVSVVNTCMPDQPFIVDSVRLCFEQSGHELRGQVNAIVSVERTKGGRLKAVGRAGDAPRESLTHFEIAPVTSAAARRKLEREILDRLVQARAMVGDFRRIVRQVKDLVNQYEFLASLRPQQREEILEAKGFLEWLADDNFVYIGLSHLRTRGEGEELRLGVSRLKKDPFEFSYPDAREFAKGSPLDDAQRPVQPRDFVLIHKTREESRLHRRGKIDEILVRTFSDRGEPTGCMAIHGLFTYRALQARGGSVPLLRQTLQRVVRLEDVTAGSFNYKSIVNAFNALPVEYLFGAKVEDVRELIRRTLASERARKMEVHLSLGGARRSAFLFVVMPRANFSDQLRAAIQDHIQTLMGANYCDHRVLMSAHGVAVLHFYLTSPREIPELDAESIERDVIALSATWEDRFRDALLSQMQTDEALALYRTYHAALSPRYQVSTEPDQVLKDVLRLERVRRGEGLQLAFYRDREDLDQGTMKLRLYEDDDLLLSDIMPILDNFGLRVVNSFANHARLADGTVLTMDTFRFRLDWPELADDPERQTDFLDALAAVFDRRMTSDALNRTLLPAGLSWEQVDLLRSYQAYAKQLGNMATPGSVWHVLVKHAAITRGIVELFEVRFGPDRQGRLASRPSPNRRKRAKEIRDRVASQIDRVESFSEDRMLRLFLNLVDATLRTNVFVEDRAHPTIAHKFDCAQVTTMPERRPWREIFVYHHNLEGVHLRGGRIARGGLRFSDRHDDFRTEILGLMTTQMVKNVVIVPLGAKGGFVVKRLPADPAERRRAGDAHYEIFIHALLDLTDDRDGGEIVPPRGVVCWDEPDPYLVVAADKGTAHLSDTANRISGERGFWLGDAFASGGSNGYDHKAIGITARGAWVCIRHHLRELGINPHEQAFTAMGIGDMGGDVFGNGFIEHDTIRLQAAFNHLHIFLDPDPDPKVSFKERKRLFSAKQGGWDQYDPKKISKGGGVFGRHDKKIPLSAPVRKMLGVEEAHLSGNELVHAILKMEVDLWYNGGIGTYVKATSETHAAAADPSNDAVRINADEMRAKVVGEGGNLGLTQAARIEFAQRGGKLNTDFIDNAGGVNCSDHEVNLKILLAPEVAAGRLQMGRRNRLLRDIEPLVTHDVLEANGDQALMLSLDERRSRADLAPFDRVTDEVCRHFNVKRSQLALPAVREMDRRMAEGEALTRPELATLSSFVKMQLYQELLEDDSLAMEGLLPALRNYFPEKVRKRFGKAVDGHSLRREIALTRLTNRIVDYTGSTFFHEMSSDCGASSRSTFEAYSLLSRAAGLWDLKDELWNLGWEVAVETKYDALLAIESALSLGTRHLLEHWPQQRVADVLRSTASYQRKLRTLAEEMGEILDPVSMERVRATEERFREAGVPVRLAGRLAQVRYLPRALVVLDLAEQSRRPAKVVARDYFALGRTSRLFNMIHWLDQLRPRAYYDALAYKTLRRDLHELLSDLVLKLLPVKGSAKAKLESLGEGAEAFSQLDRIPGDQLGPAALMVVVRQMRAALR